MSIRFKELDRMVMWLIRAGYRQDDETAEWYSRDGKWAQIKRWKLHYTVYLRDKPKAVA